jgi:hypothetical protein
MPSMNTIGQSIFALITILAFAACGGGGGSSPALPSSSSVSMATPSPSPLPSPSPSASPSPSPTPLPTGFSAEFSGYYLQVPGGITSLTTTLKAPTMSAAHQGQVVFWPGLEPASAAYVLQPTLLWTNYGASQNSGSTFGADNVETGVNPYGTYGPGSSITVNAGDTVQMSLSLSGTNWILTLNDTTTGQSAATLTYNAGGTPMTLAYFVIESHIWTAQGIPFYNNFSSVTFSNTTVTFNGSSSCQLSVASSIQTTQMDTVSAPVVTAGSCAYSTMTLYPQIAP